MSQNKENLYKIIFYSNGKKTITMEKFAEDAETALKLCVEFLEHKGLTHLFNRHTIEELPRKNEWS